MTTELRAQWDGDALERKPIADFLHRLIVEKYKASRNAEGAGSICFALDGDWGSGKTFFVNHWLKDIKSLDHPIMFFDAWKNDLSQEPLLGFVAALQEALKDWTRHVPVAKGVKIKANRASRNMLRQAGRALGPMTSAIGKGLIRKVLAVDIEELVAAFNNGESEAAPAETETTSSSSNAAKTTDEAIDKLFDNSLREHASRMRAVDDLKNAVGELLTYLETNLKADLPMFIFVDELDRCRPNYAIELLEGMKHLFNVRGLCFCVSTNSRQLSESIKGVYGAGFDSRMYLKRFFDFDYVLPKPSDHAFARLLVPNSLFLTRKKIFTGLSDCTSPEAPTQENIAKTFHFVATSFRLDLRSQRQVFAIAEAAASGIPDGKPLHILYLFALASLRHLDRELFDDLALAVEHNTIQSQRLAALIDPAFQHKYRVNISHDGSFRGEWATREIRIDHLLQRYVRLSNTDLVQIREAANRVNSRDYPQLIDSTLGDEMPNAYNATRQYPPSIRNYHVLVNTAGQLTPLDERTSSQSS